MTFDIQKFAVDAMERSLNTLLLLIDSGELQLVKMDRQVDFLRAVVDGGTGLGALHSLEPKCAQINSMPAPGVN
jgi:hypothetical protein